MNLHAYSTRGIIWAQRLVFSRLLNGINDHRPIPLDYGGQSANDYVRELLKRDEPCFVGRFGCVEIEAILRGYDISRKGSMIKKTLSLPKFDLQTYRPVSSFLGLKTPYKDWFEALDKMCDDISKIDFDVALIGCGAYGLSIGAFIKRELHRKAVQPCGVTQMLFGIRGARWDSSAIHNRLYNEFWVRPSGDECPANCRTLEGGAYW